MIYPHGFKRISAMVFAWILGSITANANDHRVVYHVTDQAAEAASLRGIRVDTPRLNIELPSRRIDNGRSQVYPAVEGPFHCSGQQPEWGPHAHYLGINYGDNTCVSSSTSESWAYICSRQGTNSITVFQTRDGLVWNYVILNYGVEINDPDIDAGSGYIYISCAFTGNRHPAVVRSRYADDLAEWDAMIYWGGVTDIRTTSVAAFSQSDVCFGFHIESEPDIHLYHTVGYPDGFYDTIAYNPDASIQTDVEMDGGYDSPAEYIYSANTYYDNTLHTNQGRVVVYEMGAAVLTVKIAERVGWSDTSFNDKLSLHGGYDKFTVAYQYKEGTQPHHIYARTYENFGYDRISLGHVANSSDSDMYPRVFHCPGYNHKGFVYLKVTGGNRIFTSVALADNNWEVTEKAIPDSAEASQAFRAICTLDLDTEELFQTAAWSDGRDNYINIYYNMELAPNEFCPGLEMDISYFTPGSGASYVIGGNLNNASDDIYEITEVGCWSGGSSTEKVYRFTPPEDLNIRIYLDYTDFDSKMAIVSPCPYASDVCMYNDDYQGQDAGFDCTEYLAGKTYSIIVTGKNEKGYYSLYLEECSETCTELGCKVTMPSDDFGPGDVCNCDVTVCNPGSQTYFNVPVFVILDVCGSYYCAPGFSAFDHYTKTVAPGETIIHVVDSFFWPSDAGSGSGLKWYAAMTDSSMTSLFGGIGSFGFGWHP